MAKEAKLMKPKQLTCICQTETILKFCKLFSSSMSAYSCIQFYRQFFFLRSIKVTKGNNSTLTKDVIVPHSSVNSQEHVLNKKLEAQNMICDTAFQKRKIIIFRLRPPCCCCCCCFCC